MIKTLRSVVGCREQPVCALDRLYLLRPLPTRLLWGMRDRMIPVHHASAPLASNPGAEVVLLTGAGHLPQLTRAEVVAERLSAFINRAAAGAPIVANGSTPDLCPYSPIEGRHAVGQPPAARGCSPRQPLPA